MNLILFYYYLRTAVTFISINLGGHYLISEFLTPFLKDLNIGVGFIIVIGVFTYSIFFIIAFDVTRKNFESIEKYQAENKKG